MIYQTQNTDDFIAICDNLHKIKDTTLTQKSLYSILISSLYNTDIKVFVSKDKELNGYMVLMTQYDINFEKALYGILLWSDAHYKLADKFLKIADKLARKEGIKKIMFSTRRNFKAVLRKYGKYGFNKAYHVIEKEVN